MIAVKFVYLKREWRNTEGQGCLEMRLCQDSAGRKTKSRDTIPPHQPLLQSIVCTAAAHMELAEEFMILDN
ncbi:unnamed protein product [Haemonchus placei]|uniref:Uncharacterized protein n=1 Tax=Haemonchus placei TaxID=6290 RepID=A0A0N4X0X6_HAEPC|nr:unnamed protein product [Haemonchus placei]